MQRSRRDFLFDLGTLVVVSSVPIVAAGCGSDVLDTPDGTADSGMLPVDSGSDASADSSVDASPTDAANVSCADVNDTIAANHPTPHVLDTVTESDVTSGATKTYMLSTSGVHSHAITLTSADFAALLSGASVQKTTTTGGGHMHSVTLSCV